MTDTYSGNPMPHRVSIKCPNCGSAAEFEFAEVVSIKLKKDVEYFKNSDAFEYGFFEDSSGSRWHAATFYRGLNETSLGSIGDLPEGYAPEDWNHSEYLYRSCGGDCGVVVCSFCGYRTKQSLNWPSDAFFQIEHKGKVLWAFHRESAVELMEYVSSEHRDRQKFEWQSFLRHIPSHFLYKGAREDVSKKLHKLLLGKDRRPHTTSE